MTRWELRWTERADRDLGRALQFYQERSPQAATRWVSDLLRRVRLLAGQPELGACVMLDRAPTPYRRILCGDYGVFYRLDLASQTVHILRVWHLSRDPGALVVE